MPRPPASASTALYPSVPCATPGRAPSTIVTDRVLATNGRACLAALQGGQAGAHLHQKQTRPAGAVRLNQPNIKTATSPSHSGGS